MSWDGMLPKRNCESCGKPLNEDGGHPAELYAGTYTGLCYKCERKPDFVLKTYVIDGALLISHPPNTPAHRRDRWTSHAYEDCDECDGSGETYEHRSFRVGGGYYRYCEKCSRRFWGHPERKRYEAARGKLWEEKIFPLKEQLNTAFNADLEAGGFQKSKSVWDEPGVKELAQIYLARFDEKKEKWLEELGKEFEYVWETHKR